jgi:3-isopropylmalate/(R)-2-methylmalate dehydratase small subunit
MLIRGRVWKFGDDINTDLIMPQVVFPLPLEEQVRYVFQANRPGWIDQVRTGDIIVAGRNFGTGSSRPGAQLLRKLGIRCLVADSINGLFFRNCVNFALPPIECPGVSQLFREGEEAEVNLESGTVKNTHSGHTLQGVQLPPFLLEIIHSGGITAMLETQGYLEKAQSVSQ